MACSYGASDPDAAGAGRVRRRVRAGREQRLVDAVPGHQLLRLGAERLRLLREPGRLRLGEQRADAGEHAGLGVPGGALPGLAGLVRALQGLQGGQAQQQAVQLQDGGGVREAVRTRRRRGAAVQVRRAGAVQRGPAGPVVRLPAARDQRRHQAYVYVVQLAPYEPYDVGGLPAAPPGRRHELLAAPGEFGVRRRVGGEQGGAGVEGGVGVGVEGGLEGAFHGAGRVGAGAGHPPIVPCRHRRLSTLRLTAPLLSTYG